MNWIGTRVGSALALVVAVGIGVVATDVSRPLTSLAAETTGITLATTPDDATALSTFAGRVTPTDPLALRGFTPEVDAATPTATTVPDGSLHAWKMAALAVVLLVTSGCLAATHAVKRRASRS
ncbi:hypothetical protein [Leifsonia shinshuensis]|uniref:Uncharacterized protein n=1 Tax=Leifsonia shinshuensis TaxID=150026 RepID=A0A7G6YDF4_9MICO|nr:hypothetical protein [Leifsonia shinshuensis]QNE36519.1 hypothetical protein F1C12_16310 [Leifsonia shinshuensis]